MTANEIIALAQAGFNVQQIAAIASTQTASVAQSVSGSVANATVASATPAAGAPAPTATVPQGAPLGFYPAMAPAQTPSPSPSPSPSTANAMGMGVVNATVPAQPQGQLPGVGNATAPGQVQLGGVQMVPTQDQDIMKQLGIMLNQAAINMSQQPPQESTDDILAQIINPPGYVDMVENH